MHPSIPRARPSSRMFSALIGFVVLFAAITAGYSLVDAAQTKWQDATWTGNHAGAALSGFLKGADKKATKTDPIAFPDVLPAMHTVNDRLFAAHAPLFAWLVTLGESFLPLGVLILLCVRFRGSHAAALTLTALAASLNFLYMLEGSSGVNPPLMFMWLAVLWLLATLPEAALFFAIDLRERAPDAATARRQTIESSTGQWVFFVVVLLLVAVGGWIVYPPSVCAALMLGSGTLAVALFLFHARVGSPRRSAPTAVGQPTRDTASARVGPSR
ncbi:MAG: hypothetical protein M3Y58_23820 [Chloroflexota bacterium]|nr:hypothetical protein [Chloroflexota bacterium]